MNKIKYIVYFTYKLEDGGFEYKYRESFDTLLSKEDFIKETENNFGNTLKVVSIDKIEKETTIIEEIQL